MDLSEYPNFYTRLYSLLTPALLHTKYRARFFRLLTISSPHLSCLAPLSPHSSNVSLSYVLPLPHKVS